MSASNENVIDNWTEAGVTEGHLRRLTHAAAVPLNVFRIGTTELLDYDSARSHLPRGNGSGLRFLRP